MTADVGDASTRGSDVDSSHERATQGPDQTGWRTLLTDIPAGIARSDWWPAALGPARWRAWHKESHRAKVAGDVGPPRRFGPWYAIARLVVTPLYRTMWRVHVEGGERLPHRGPAILAANHVSFFDSVVLIMTLRRTLSFVGKVEYLDSWKTRRVLPALGMIPVDRGDGRRALAALKIATEVLRAGNLFAIYPEGTRSQDGDLHAGHTGAAYLSIATGVPIVPTGIVGTDRIQPPGAQVPRPFRPVTVRFGTPIDPTDYLGSRRHRRRLITDDLMAAIQALSGQNQADTPPRMAATAEHPRSPLPHLARHRAQEARDAAHTTGPA